MRKKVKKEEKKGTSTSSAFQLILAPREFKGGIKIILCS